MVIITGQKPYGKCDVVPGLFYVATLFFHFDYIPLIPLGTKLILSQKGKQYFAINLPFSFKSLALAWSRAGLLVASIVFGALTLIVLDQHQWALHEDAVSNLVLTLFCGVLCAFLMIYPVRRMPSYERACELARIAGLNDTGWAALNVLYGRDPFDRPSQTDTLSVRK